MKRILPLSLFALTTLLPLSSFGITRHAVILVMDGARYTETLGDPAHANVPKIAALALQGAELTKFRTAATGSVAESWTETCPGHARLTTGTYQNIANDGSVLPSKPGMFQLYRQQTSGPATSGWVICSKDKLRILANSSLASGMNNQYQPSMNCGVNGNGTGGYRADSLTHAIVKQKLAADHPALMIINYKGPDEMGHQNNWNGYLAAIKEVDGYADDIWNAIQADDSLKNTTALFIVNDHGRHTADFTSHGDNCDGCRNIMCVVLGPDIRIGFTDTTTREQIDVAPTIASLMGFTVPTSTGNVMSEIIEPATFVRHDRKSGFTTLAPGKITVALGSNRSVVFSHLPGDAAIEIFTLTGARVAGIAADPSRQAAVWNTASPSGVTVAGGCYFCKVTSRRAGTYMVRANVPW
jgi:hypothetical protein